MKGYVIQEGYDWFVKRIPEKGDIFGRLKDAKVFPDIRTACSYIKGMEQEDEYGNYIARYLYEVESDEKNNISVVRHINGGWSARLGHNG